MKSEIYGLGVALAIALVMCIVVGIILTYDNRNGIEQDTPARDYQIYIDNDSVHLYDGYRKVGVAPWTDGLLDSLILKDNL